MREPTAEERASGAITVCYMHGGSGSACSDCVTRALHAHAEAERERCARIAETKVACELHAMESGERDPLCALTAATAATCLTHGRDIAAAIRAQGRAE